MKTISFDRDEMKAIVREVQDYFDSELDQPIGALSAEMLVLFFAERIGPYFYNRGLFDAQGLIKEKVDDLTDAVFALEKPTKYLR